MKKIVLIGNPNVGKSVVFTRLTGVHTVASNYPGTTVEFTSGEMLFQGREASLIDAPGMYSTAPSCKAEEVALRMLGEADAVINVVDAGNLERNLGLTLQVLDTGLPMVVLLNMWDETSHRGISIDAEGLERMLGCAVIPTVAVTGEGIKRAMEALEAAPARPARSRGDMERWGAIGAIITDVQSISCHRHTLGQSIEDLALNPVGGLLIAALVLACSFALVRTIGEGLIRYIFDPLFGLARGPLDSLSSAIAGHPFVHDVLIGRLIGGRIDFLQSFGLLTTGLYIELAVVLPYIVGFYLVLGFLEDVGYLPRLAVLLDRAMHHMGLHGYAIMPHLLGLGCNVPGIMATRNLESRRERFIAITLISIGVPCASLQAMIIGLVGHKGLAYVFLVYGIIFLSWLVTGFVLARIIRKSFSPEHIIEMPPIRVPNLHAFVRKFWMRMVYFLREALPVVTLAVLFVGALYSLGLFDRAAALAAPVVERLWGLPREAAAAIAIGFLRKDVAMGMLSPLGLSTQQLVVGSVVLAMTFPCIATFVMIARELGLKLLGLSTLVMLIAAVAAGTLSNAALSLIL
jgi:ferrous iron transport protein B